ncbi:MAG: exodeoxyribonuclease VII large subunit [Clostridia bacterium]|nr:exodeoxyribonuclease VII large subunit [Clostridia bacterium]
MSAPSALTVAQLNFYVKSLLEGDRNLKNLWIRGELSNFIRNAKSGHCYFSLKDRESSVKAVMFNGRAEALTFVPRDGMQVLLQGRVSLYERDGQYQFYVDRMLPDGLGALYLEYLRLKETLEREGLFSDKRPLPPYPRTVGVCTSSTGAAVRDVLSVCSRLAPSVSVCVYPCLMQGSETVPSVLRALEYFRNRPETDVVIIARGGGSYEDLAVFNDETLARTVASFPLPVISAIGHETDVTILDFVSDFRAATPSVAAEVAVGAVPEAAERLQRARRSVSALAEQRLRLESERLRSLRFRLDPQNTLDLCFQRLDHLDFRLRAALQRQYEARFAQFSRLSARLTALNPMSVLSRGYALAEKDNLPVRSASEISEGDRIVLNFEDGVIGCVADYKEARKL